MKKTVLMTAALLLSSVAFAAANPSNVSQGLDCEIFLNPYVETVLKGMSGKVVVDAGCSVTPHSAVALSDRFTKIANGMQAGERLMVASPASYGVVFTNGRQSEEAVYHHIHQVLAKIGKNNNPNHVMNQLSELTEVMRATFIPTDSGLKLVTNERGLKNGQRIWCKTPEGVVATVYHSEEDYLTSLSHAGFTCEEIKRPCFFGKVKYDMWHAEQQGAKSLGGAYMHNNPFTIFYVVKRAA